MSDLSARLSRIKPSPTLTITQKALELKAKGVDVLSFSAGEPDFDTPPHIVAAAKRALDEGMTRYTPVPGIPALREAIAEDGARARGVPSTAENVVVTVGAKHALYGFFQSVLSPGDEVIVPAPYWVSYPDQVLLAGGAPVIARTRAESGWVLSPEDLEAAASERTRAVVINTPGNPTGAVYPREAVERLVRKALDLDLWIVSDEIYRDLVYGAAEHFSPATAAGEGWTERVFVADGVSKTYAMTGWRIGWGIGRADLVKSIAKIQGQSTSNACSMAQAAALAAITSPKGFLEEWRAEYVRRRDRMIALLEAMDGVSCAVPEGAFYVLASVQGALDRAGSEMDDVALCTRLLEEARIAAVPGSAFGAPGHVRLSYATSIESIETGLARMGECLAGI